MTETAKQAAKPEYAPRPPSEQAIGAGLLRAREQAWLRLQKDAQAREQCRQL